jgi:hypothetical protein
MFIVFYFLFIVFASVVVLLFFGAIFLFLDFFRFCFLYIFLIYLIF